MLTHQQALEITRRSREEVIRGNYHHVTLDGGVTMMPHNLDEIIREVVARGEEEPLEEVQDTTPTEETLVF